MIPVSMLLKSCASPPVSCPTASIFWDWRSVSSGTSLSRPSFNSRSSASATRSSRVLSNTSFSRQVVPRASGGNRRTQRTSTGPTAAAARRTSPTDHRWLRLYRDPSPPTHPPRSEDLSGKVRSLRSVGPCSDAPEHSSNRASPMLPPSPDAWMQAMAATEVD
jgi:hypothetical protein